MLNKMRCLLEEVGDSLVDIRLSMTAVKRTKSEKDEESESQDKEDESEEEHPDAKIPASQEQISRLLDQGVYQDKWLSVMNADLWEHYLSEREGCS